ncbi:EF-hand domain-containing protein [Sphingomonas mucosissima]|uniref:Transaldolase/EF-hand domain-containing protein n=1 Tax=Sphingomonas mucosissima TaxID=370959 RepID=A0A245ZTB0_9SPHN|nr:EF-hand domain-containing protein [Sphingomonas mucosissima]OWK32982.1 transaldolase/EF-hand domain-containing protein [Sphingomonas mucosissima]
MWRYLAGGLAALLMVAAGWSIYSGRARTDPMLPPPPPPSAMSSVQEPGAVEAPVPEASERTREEKRFDRYDKDRDSRITREEYLASRRKAFAKLDADGDGRLSFEEWAAKTTAKFTTADRDKSGMMDRAEFATTAVKRKAKAKPKCVCPAGGAAEEE